MNVNQFLIRDVDKRFNDLIKAAKSLPEGKLDWQPSEKSRSALSMLQECATAIDEFWDAGQERKIAWSDEKFNSWRERRAKLTTIEELEATGKKGVARLSAAIDAMDENELDLPVEMPFPGEFKLADILSYHAWNFGYHEGQIYYIQGLC